MMRALRAVTKLLLGETWQLPLGVAAAVLVATALRLETSGAGWWRHGGGAVLAALLGVALVSAIAATTRRTGPPERPGSTSPENGEDPVNEPNGP
jgi:hypothetical protein